MTYLVLAYYRFIAIENPSDEVQKHKDFFNGKDVAGRIYISEEGINGQMSGIEKEALAYMEWLRSDPRFSTLDFKIHRHHENVFPRMDVKIRKQLVALDCAVDRLDGGTYLSPKEWKEMLEANEEKIVLDVRNDYEWKIGHFEGATLPSLENFRDFPAYAEELKEKLDPKTKIMMYCTGGIRCELYSALLKKKGFQHVYQLEGGILNYGLKEGRVHWKGKLFVFDDRLAIEIDAQSVEPISRCQHCHLPCSTYHNCANMDCNELFICCPSCLEVYRGCCLYTCTTAPRVRPSSNKPFRRKHLL